MTYVDMSKIRQKFQQIDCIPSQKNQSKPNLEQSHSFVLFYPRTAVVIIEL